MVIEVHLYCYVFTSVMAPITCSVTEPAKPKVTCALQAFLLFGISITSPQAAVVLTASHLSQLTTPTGLSEVDTLYHPLNLNLATTTATLRLWVPVSGTWTPVNDPTCDLRTVSMVVSPSNLWANVQQAGAPWDMDWNLNNLR